MSYNFKETMNKPERLAPGHRMCAGCGGTIAVRNVLRGLHEGDKAVIGNATGCLEVSTFTYPYTAWEDSYIHNAFENAVVVKLIDKVQDPIPHCMFEHRADSLMNQFANQLKAQGVPMDMYLQYTGMDQDSLKATYLDRAENEVKLRLALEKIAELENLSVSDEELEAEIAKLAEENNLTPEDVKKRIYTEDLRQDMLATKAMDLVRESAVATDAPEEAAEEKTEEAATEE